MEELMKSLIYIQQNLNAPKGQFNNFGKYSYRSLEDIEAAIKPLLQEQQCGIYFQDEVVERCGRTFLKTTLTFFNTKGNKISTTAEAEHSIQKTGMDSAQITGSASSYARKYAMNALFCIDDTKDPDSNEQTQQQQTRRPYQRKDSDPLAGIKKALSNVSDMNGLLDLYNQHKNEVSNNPEVKALFTQRKAQLETTVNF